MAKGRTRVYTISIQTLQNVGIRAEIGGVNPESGEVEILVHEGPGFEPIVQQVRINPAVAPYLDDGMVDVLVDGLQDKLIKMLILK